MKSRTSRLLLVAATASLLALAVDPAANAQGAVRTPSGYVGVFAKSQTNKVGSQVVFASLHGPKPFVTWPGGNGAETAKVFEDDEFVVLFFIASATGGTETFYLNKRQRQFTVVEASMLGAMSAPGEFVRPMISHGTLQ